MGGYEELRHEIFAKGKFFGNNYEESNKIAPGTANYDTLLYGAEVKFYSARLQLTPELETALPNFFAAGDGAGVTRGLAQAGASGIQAARAICKRV